MFMNLIKQTWLTQYPWPQQVIYYQGTKFLLEFAQMLNEDWGITPYPITKQNPHADGVHECVHQTLGNMIQTFKVHEDYLDKDDLWKGALSATMFVFGATYHMDLQAMSCKPSMVVTQS